MPAQPGVCTESIWKQENRLVIVVTNEKGRVWLTGTVWSGLQVEFRLSCEPDTCSCCVCMSNDVYLSVFINSNALCRLLPCSPSVVLGVVALETPLMGSVAPPPAPPAPFAVVLVVVVAAVVLGAAPPLCWFKHVVGPPNSTPTTKPRIDIAITAAIQTTVKTKVKQYDQWMSFETINHYYKTKYIGEVLIDT